jgi:4,5-DOPA dioxygenase extradiol
MDGSLDPQKNWEVGKAVQQLRREGILVLSGGLTYHNLREIASFSEVRASPSHKAFDTAVLDAVTTSDADQRKQAMFDLVHHPNFRDAHPREDHFVPVYIAAGAGEGGSVHVLHANYGVHTYAFGV